MEVIVLHSDEHRAETTARTHVLGVASGLVCCHVGQQCAKAYVTSLGYYPGKWVPVRGSIRDACMIPTQRVRFYTRDSNRQ